MNMKSKNYVKESMEELLTVGEVAEQLKISKATVRRHIREGRLRAVKIGRVVRISAKEIKSLYRPIVDFKQSKSGFKPSTASGLTAGDLDWFEGCRRLSREIKKRRSGVLLEDSSEVIRNLRKGRTLGE